MTRAMNEHSRALVQKLWNYCNLLRDDGLSYGDYVEQLTYLLFLKMAHERTEPPRMEPSRLPAGFDWPSLVTISGADLETHYVAVLQRLGTEPGLLGLIFRKAQNRIQDPTKLQAFIGRFAAEVLYVHPKGFEGIKKSLCAIDHGLQYFARYQ